MDQIERIKKMEEYLDETDEAVKELHDALEKYGNVTGKIDELEEYYVSGQWLSDFEDDEEGKLPSDLKRGVLSEDALFDLLNEAGRAERIMRSLAAEDDSYPYEYRYEIGYVNGILDLAGRFSKTISYSYVQAYGLKNDDIASSISKLSEMDFNGEWLRKSEESLNEKLKNWFGMDDLGEMIERELGTPVAVYDINDEFISRSSDMDISWTAFYFIEDGFVAEYEHFALLFLIGNNE